MESALTPCAVHIIKPSKNDIVSWLVISPTNNQKLLQSSEYKVHGPDICAIRRLVVHSLGRRIQIPLVLFVQQGQRILNKKAMADIWSGDGIVADPVVVPSRLLHYKSLVVYSV